MIKVASLNCRGLNKKLKRKSIFAQFLQNDIIMLQETYITKEKFADWQLDWNGNFFYVEGTNNSNGLITLINSKFSYDDIELTIKNERILGLKIKFQDIDYYFLNIYVPNIKKEKCLS